jgi:hypothetical protein
VIVRFARAVLGVVAAVVLCAPAARAQDAVVPVLGPLQDGAIAGYEVSWTTLVDGTKTLSVSSLLSMRQRGRQKIVTTFRASRDEGSVYVMTRHPDGTLSLDNVDYLDRTGMLLGQALATLNALAQIDAGEPADAQAWTKSLPIAMAVPDANATPPPVPLLALAATRASRPDGFSVSATGTTTQDVAATPAPAAMRLIGRVLHQKPGQATTTCTLEGRFTASGVLTSGTFETKSTTVVGRHTSVVDTTWHVTRVN